MRRSIVGEKWHNATASDIQDIDVLISQKQDQINTFTKEYEQARDALTACYGLSQAACLAKTGGYAHSTWSPIYDTRPLDIARAKNELADLNKRRSQLVSDLAASNVVISGSLDVTDKDTTVTAKKYGTYIGIGLGAAVLIIGGIIAYKKFRKK